MDQLSYPNRKNLQLEDLFFPYDKHIPCGVITGLGNVLFEYRIYPTIRYRTDMPKDINKRIRYNNAFGKFYRKNKEGKLVLLFRTPKNIDNE